MASGRFDESVSALRTIDPWLPTAAVEQPDRKSLRPLPLPFFHLRRANSVEKLLWNLKTGP
jgi:hypothetical protein